MRTRTWRVLLAAGLALVTSVLAAGSQRAGEPLSFLACPVIRDTETLPCWLAEYQGELYYLGTQGSTSSAFYPPQLLHEVLVEATIGEGPRVCGGLHLVAVEVSVMPEINRACNTILPAEPQYSAPPSPPAPIPAFADTTLEFEIAYDFDSDYLTLHTTRVVLEAVRIAKASGATRVEIHGPRGATRLSDGRVLTERPDMGRARAGKMRDILIGLGLAPATVSATWDEEPAAADGVHDVTRRRVTIRLR